MIARSFSTNSVMPSTQGTSEPLGADQGTWFESFLDGLTAGVIVETGDTAPAGFLLCNGTSFSSSTYPDLYTQLGTTVLPNTVAADSRTPVLYSYIKG